jgi:ubiquinone/menaquinone biosynthesis C-methylase UbiE
MKGRGFMGQEINLMDLYPRSKRPIDQRGAEVSQANKDVAGRFGQEYFDGDRMFGYGGYQYHPRFWTDTVKRFRDHYALPQDARILDVGCAKGFMMSDFQKLMPQAHIEGLDISTYAKEQAIAEMKPLITVGNAKDLPFEDDSFDLVICINTIHNLAREDCREALQELERVSRKHAFLTVDAWRNDQEKESMLKWNLTAKTYMHVDDWKQFFTDAGYTKDYYWFIAESA